MVGERRGTGDDVQDHPSQPGDNARLGLAMYSLEYNLIMNLLKRFKYPILIILILMLTAGGFFMGSKYALDHLAIRQITPTQAATAMKEDHFWASYREDTLLITGTVISVSHDSGGSVVGLKTDSSYGAQCSFRNRQSGIQTGQTIKVLTIANAAERLSSGVQLNDCLLQ